MLFMQRSVRISTMRICPRIALRTRGPRISQIYQNKMLKLTRSAPEGQYCNVQFQCILNKYCNVWKLQPNWAWMLKGIRVVRDASKLVTLKLEWKCKAGILPLNGDKRVMLAPRHFFMSLALQVECGSPAFATKWLVSRTVHADS